MAGGMQVQHKTDQGSFQSGPGPQIKWKTSACNFRGPVKIKNIEPGADVPVGQRLKIKGGRRADGFPTDLYYEFTVIDGVQEDSQVSREESFGPVLPILSAADDDAAVALANRTRLRDYAAAIGPEGGFTEKENEHALNQGFTQYSLGSLIYRIETAAISMAAYIRTLFVEVEAEFPGHLVGVADHQR